jgi:putative sterol carrier protein
MAQYPSIKQLFRRKMEASEASAADIDDSMQAAAKLLGKGKDVGRLQVQLISKRASTYYIFDVLGGDCRVTNASSDNRDFELVVSEETWVQLANGELSPVDAYLTGRLELTGDIEFAKRQYAKAKARGTIEDLPV